MSRNLIAAFLVCASLALLVSLIPNQGLQPIVGDVPTFQRMDKLDLTEENLVDLFTIIPTHYNIKRVKWDNGSLYVDMAIPPTQVIDLTRVYRDFYMLTYQSFTVTRNVKHLYFRMLSQGAEHPTKLLVAIEADRDKEKNLVHPQKISDIRLFVEKSFSVTTRVN